MKRYTGQKALYEAISRSRAKTLRRGNILERFLPDATRQEKPAPQEEIPPAEQGAAPADVPPAAATEPSKTLPEKPREPVVVRENSKLRRLPTVEKPEVKPPRPVEEVDRPAPLPPKSVPMWWRLKPLQLNAGRIEVSAPYHIGVAVALTVILVMLVAFRMGQKHPGAKTKAAAPVTTSAQATPQSTTAESQVAKPAQTAGATASGSAAESASQTAQPDHWIVLTTYKNRDDLVPVVEHFEKNGIELEIRDLQATRELFADKSLNIGNLPSGKGYLLVTKYLFTNPKAPGTKGYELKQKIAEVGKTYKAPKGRETFAPKLFSDAYAMKITK
jgi:hypothetical protein